MRILISGVAGFIGSNFLKKLLLLPTDYEIIGVDDFSLGRQENIDHVRKKVGEKAWRRFRLERIRLGLDARNVMLEFCGKADIIFHLAAHGSVPRSIESPTSSFKNNVEATQAILEYARLVRTKRVVIASSSSVYGDNSDDEKTEERTGRALSPYAATKKCCEALAQSYFSAYGIETVCLRFFNVFGPYQRANSAYAAVIPKWINKILNGETIEVYGDGEQRRDFTYVDNVTHGLLLAGFGKDERMFGEAFNIACGGSISLNELYNELSVSLIKIVPVAYLQARNGDIKNSCADISKAKEILLYQPTTSFEKGISQTLEYFQKQGGYCDCALE